MLGLPDTDAAGNPHHCDDVGKRCHSDGECCSGVCANGRCAPPPCDGVICNGQCVTCNGGALLDPATCQCVPAAGGCPVGTTTCGDTCCGAGQTCVDGQCLCPAGGCTEPGQTVCNGTCCSYPQLCDGFQCCTPLTQDQCPPYPSCGQIYDPCSGRVIDCNTCSFGEVCSPEGQCVPGCATDADCGECALCNPLTNICQPAPNGTLCPSGVCQGQVCTGCSTNADCPVGYACQAGLCVAVCPPGQTLCGTTCVNTSSDPNNCGTCNNFCPSYPNAVSGCSGGQCVMLACNAGYADCNGFVGDGCEVHVLSDNNNCGACGNVCPGGTTCLNGACAPIGAECASGQTQTCYSGPAGTMGVGICSAGTQTCQSDGTWGP
jgi:hypothetical protein